MQITALSQNLAGDVLKLMDLGGPFIRARTPSDYWLDAQLFPPPVQSPRWMARSLAR